MRAVSVINAMLFYLVIINYANANGETFKESLDASDAKMGSRTFSIKIDKSRLIFNEDEFGEILTVYNTHEYPVLVQTYLLNEDKQTKNNKFISTPPIFKLDANQQSKIRIVPKAVTSDSGNKESLSWVCVKGIPPKTGDVWDEGYEKSPKKSNLMVNIAVSNCIKLIARPPSLPPIDSNSKLKVNWKISKGKLVAFNLTPYYINFNSLAVNEKVISNGEYVAPYSRKEITVNGGIRKGQNVSWEFITDLGGVSKVVDDVLE
ncbi:TPA: molecular chaperone [Escherichia coli]|uniref:fimbrial biogenesis chaperone n=2 Tax=Escherichia coli TaxID=562 RepID=UPI0002495B54|nr:molecular chaperone [Escherichia coli]EHP63456.1 hypothetical protein HMPREF0986_04518 [Escherichia coli 4_1_47FAA]EKK6907449.1 molecular chaperone [Shigella sonnei]EFH6848542.1 fimbria/pilus periplasmic chaperone [Escherichia coli]EFJ2779244.1 molecular chaperone [Escherichia coli]EFJ2868904.1 molecular chaperone [Escherichia coli]